MPFRGTQALTEVSVPALKELGAGVFDGSSVTAIVLPGSVSSVAEQAFAGATQLASITVEAANPDYLSDDGVPLRRTGSNDYATLVAYPEGKQDTSFTVRDRTIRIGAYAFADNVYVQEVTLPVHVRVIGAAAFYGCTALNRIVFRPPRRPRSRSYTYVDGRGRRDDRGQRLQQLQSGNGGRKVGTGITIVVPANHTGYDLYIWDSISANSIPKSTSPIPTSPSAVRSTSWTA